MNKDELSLAPMEFESPIEFILVGVEGKQRAIVAKSIGAKLDLAAYAQRQRKDEERPYLSRSILLPFPFPNSIELWPLSVDSHPTEFRNNGSYDERASELTLVWRGQASYGDIRDIEKEFNIRAYEIAESIDNKSKSRLEWLLAPIIDRCNKLTSHSREKRLRYRYTILFSLLIYLIIISAFIANKFLLK